MYTITIMANSNPYSMGWSDPVMLHDGEGNLLWSGVGSTCPNHKRPSTGKSWKHSYGWIKDGVYNVRTEENHYKYGKCVLINDGGYVLARYPNVNHSGDCILNEVFIHEGNRNSGNSLHRASAGCPTICPQDWQSFQEALPSGRGILIIKDVGSLSC